MEKAFLELIEEIRQIDNGEYYNKLVSEKDLDEGDKSLLLRLRIMRNFVQQGYTGPTTDLEKQSFDAACRIAHEILQEKWRSET